MQKIRDIERERRERYPLDSGSDTLGQKVLLMQGPTLEDDRPSVEGGVLEVYLPSAY